MTKSTVRSPDLRRIAVFDVCNTLFVENTTAGFVDYYCKDKKLRWRGAIVRSLRKRNSPMRLVAALLHRIGAGDWTRWILVRMLEGQSAADLRKVASRYVDHLIDCRAVEAVWPLVDRERRTSNLIFASASLCVVVQDLANRFEAKAISSQLEFVDDICTGRLSVDATGRKEELIAPLLAEAGRTELFVCTDNASDRGLLLMANEGVAVCYPGRNGLLEARLPDSVYRMSVSRQGKLQHGEDA